MQLFYTSEVTSDSFLLEGDDHRHCSKVLRKAIGNQIVATDGKGMKYSGPIENIERHSTKVSIKKQEEMSSLPWNLSIALAPTKNIARFEWFLEKATEIGIQHIYPILSRYSERKHLKIERSEKIVLSAMKQSQQFFKPNLYPLQSFDDFISNVANNFQGQKFIGYVDQENVHLKSKYQAKKDVLIMIGPEGDFSEKEIELALANDFNAMSLGRNRLRTETAGIVATQIINGINE